MTPVPDPHLDAADRLAARRAEITSGARRLVTAGVSTAEAISAFRNALRPPDVEGVIPRDQLLAALELLRIDDPPGVLAVQIDTDLTMRVWRRRHANHPDGGHLTAETHPIDQRSRLR